MKPGDAAALGPETAGANSRMDVYRGTRSLVTGGAGFIGSNLVRALHVLGSHVVVVDSLADGQGGNRFNLQELGSEIDFRVADIRDAAAMKDAVAGCDFVFNLAAVVNHLESLRDPFPDLDVNVRGQLTVLEAVRKHAPDATVVYAGTRSAYGSIQATPVNESHPFLPTEVNSANRAAADLYHLAYHFAHGLKALSLRVTNIYGPRMQISEQSQGFMNWFVRTAIEGGTFRLYGDGSQVRDLLYVDDMVGAFLLAATTPAAAGQAFNPGSGCPASLRQIAELLIEITGRGRIDLVPFPEDARRIEIGDYVADTTKMAAVTGWQAEVSLEEGLQRTVRYFTNYREHYW